MIPEFMNHRSVIEPAAGIARATVDHAKQCPHSIERAFKVKALMGHGLERSVSRTSEGEDMAEIE